MFTGGAIWALTHGHVDLGGTSASLKEAHPCRYWRVGVPVGLEAFFAFLYQVWEGISHVGKWVKNHP